MYSTAITALSGSMAVDQQEEAMGKGNQAMGAYYQQAREDMKPYRETGARSLAKMEGDEYMKDFTMADYEADPGYAFRMAEGQKALDRSASARGGILNGGTLRAITKYGQDMGSQEYGNAYNRFNADRDRRFGRLNTMAGMGFNAASATINPGMQVGMAMNQNHTAFGNAQAANTIATGKAINNGIQSGIMSMGTGMGGGGMGSMMGGMGGGGGGMSGGMPTSVGGASGMYGGSGAMFSDRRLKTDIKPVDPAKLAELKKHLKAYSYKYLNTEHGEGERIGVMAQDLQKSELGRSIVFKDNDGNLKIDLAMGLGLALAALAGE
jgi:hypothetical protein